MTDRRLIEETFPLQEVSEHSKHEKNVRHGHISTLHIWPARRPLAASRAAIIAALMPDPGDEAERQRLSKKIVSITKWKTENGPALDYFREEIGKAYGGRPPRVLDMFAGGGAIPLEAMRLGCDVTAIDYNPVAWFILKCTLEFPQRLAGKTWPLPQSGRRKKGAQAGQMSLGLAEPAGKQGDLADHVRYWGNWVLKQARQELSPYYPTVNGQSTVAYLWARTVPCPDPKCGTIVPLLKTLWLSKKAEKTLPDTPENRARHDFLRLKTTRNTSKVVINGRRALRLLAPKKGEGGPVMFEIWAPGPKDKVPGGTVSGARTTCPCCGINISKSYIKECGRSGRLGSQMTSAVVDAGWGKDYRLPAQLDFEAVEKASLDLETVASRIPFGLPNEPLPQSGTSGASRAFTIPLYGFESWLDIFTCRQLVSIATFVEKLREAYRQMLEMDYSEEWAIGLLAYLTCVFDKMVDYNSTICTWYTSNEQIRATSARNALPVTWDFAEAGLLESTSGGFPALLKYTLQVIGNLHSRALTNLEKPTVLRQSATDRLPPHMDIVITDPPYYDAIPYADLSDFFFVWIRRVLCEIFPDTLGTNLTPKAEELVQKNKLARRKENYEAGMAQAFQNAYNALKDDGRFVVVFAHKDYEAWETLTTSMIQAGFTVTASWPVDTEMTNRARARDSAALASSIWLVCRKRKSSEGVGRYRTVRKLMEERVTERLRYFWDMGLSGPDFVWAAIGPALESFSSYAEVKRLDGSPFTVSDFLKDVRRMVADFALGQILKGHSTEGLDEWTRYYLMHRNNFGLEDAPVGECILLSQGYGLDLNDLRSDRGFIVKSSGSNVRLTKWDERTRDDLGDPHPSGGLPLIDMLHRLMHLWAAGSLDALNGYAAENGLRQNDLFWAVAQAILEMAPAQSRERTLLEALVAWGRGKTAPSVEKLELPLTFAEGDS